MNKKLGLLVVLVVLLVVVAGALFVMGKRNAPATVPTENTQEPVVQAPKGTGTLLTLAALQGDYQCAFSYTTPEGMSMSGMSYLSGGKMRGTYDMQQPDGNFAMNVIRDSEFTYTWGEGPQGAMAVKFKNDAMPSATGSENATGTSPQASFEQEVEYECTAWGVDASVFTPPADVTFMDLSTMMTEGIRIEDEGTSFTGDADQCASCESLPAEAQQACLEALSC